MLCACREQLAFDFLKKVCERFESSPELGSALVLHIQLLLQRGKELLGKQKIEDVITGRLQPTGHCDHCAF